MAATDRAKIDEAARKLYRAELERRPVSPLTETYTDLSLSEAYQVQLAIVALKRAAGARVVGKKTGLTSKSMQRLLGIDEPDFGHLLESMMVPDGGDIPLQELIQPKVEAEIAFLLGQDLQGSGVTVEDALAATRCVIAALEIIDSRIKEWRIKLADTVADNASSGRVVLGRKALAVIDLDLRLVGMVLEKNGEPIATGAGAAVLGHPARAVAWLANKLAEFGLSLKANEVILPGALCAAVEVGPGDTITAAFDRLGTVSVRFV